MLLIYLYPYAKNDSSSDISDASSKTSREMFICLNESNRVSIKVKGNSRTCINVYIIY